MHTPPVLHPSDPLSQSSPAYGDSAIARMVAGWYHPTASSKLTDVAGKFAQGRFRGVVDGDLPDRHLLLLAAELQDAARPYLAYDRDGQVTPADPDYAEAMETARRLYADVKAVADRIFSHQPKSITGLLVLGHAATLTCGDAWESNPEHGGQDGQLLRLICNGLFRIAGVDWRGQSLPGRETCRVAPAALIPDAALIPLVDAAIAEERAALAVSKATNHDVPPGTFARSMQLLELVTATDACTPAGVAAKARLLLTHIPGVDELDGDWRCAALALSLARDAARLGAAG